MKLLLFFVFLLSMVQNGQNDMTATANIHIDSTEIGIGTVLFYQRDADSPVRIVGIIDSLKADSVHGFHVHRDPLGESVFNCSGAGPHFNPYETLHGPREADVRNRHVGDLGNVTANNNGVIIIEITDPIVSLYNAERSIANRTIVLHAIRDDGGKGGFPDSNTTGDAGARIACGVITLAEGKSNTMSNPWKISTTIDNFMKKIFP